MFKNVIVKKPCSSMIDGLSSANLGKPNFQLAMQQHEVYIETLKKCGVSVTVLEADENYPDSCFIEDVALLTKECAIITRPGATSRRGEIVGLRETLEKFYKNIENIEAPGTIEAGDIMMVGNHFYIGLSARTNEDGAKQMISILNKYGLSGSMVTLEKVLHLKTGLAYLENNNLLVAGEFVYSPIFSSFNKIVIDEKESYSANCIWLNGHVIVPLGYENTKKAIEDLGYIVHEVDTSEFRKLDGGLSCLSLRF
jgi:dimethylargininase